MRIAVFSGKLAKLSAEALAVGCFEDVRPLRGLAGEIDWLYSGIFSNLLSESRITGKRGEILLLSTQGKMRIPKVLLVGLGPGALYNYAVFNEVAQKLSHLMLGLRTQELAVELELPYIQKRDLPRHRTEGAGPAAEAPRLDLNLLMESFLKGMEEKKRTDPFELTFVVKESEKARALQQKMVNGKYLWKDTQAVLGS
jgi:hypothetical protein